MAHELAMIDGKASMAYIDGVRPWHGLGNMLAPSDTITDEVIEMWADAAGLNYQVLKSNVYYRTCRDPNAPMSVDTENNVLFRDDNKARMGLVSRSYKVVQPKAVLKFFQHIAAEFTGVFQDTPVQLTTAGALFDGRRYWAMARLGEGVEVADPRDKVAPYLLLTSSCDGTYATTGKFIWTQVVCNNTLTAAFGEKGKSVKMKHKSEFDPARMKAELGIGQVRESFDTFIDGMRDLAKTAMDKQSMAVATLQLMQPGVLESGDEKALEKAIKSKPVARILDMAVRGTDSLHRGVTGSDGTAYAWLNAVTQYIDHEGNSHTDENAFDSAMFGKGSDLKSRAFGMARDASQNVVETATATGATLLADLLAKPAKVLAAPTPPAGHSDAEFARLLGQPAVF